MTSPICLTIAGSDSSAGAGIQADLKTFSALGCYGMSVITASTAQTNETISNVHYLPTEHIEAQLDATLNYYPIDAIKVGMLGTFDVIDVLKNQLSSSSAKIIVDPVLSASCSGSFNKESLASYYIQKLAPIATLLTPNLPEALALFSCTETELQRNAQAFSDSNNTFVLITGGHTRDEDITDTLYIPGARLARQYSNPRLATKNDHGTGCTLASAITAFIATKFGIEAAVEHAEQYLHKVLTQSIGYLTDKHPTNALNLPMDHHL